MSNKIIKNTKKYTVKEFCEKYNKTNVEQLKKSLIEEIMNRHYVSYEMKITICEKIIESSYYKKNDDGNTKKLHINSPAQYMLYYLWLVKQYTNIEINFENSLEEFNLLNECGLLDIITNNIPERELKEFRMILDMVENDVLQNEYEIHAFVSNQIERFGELTGYVLKPVIEQLNKTLENMDENTVDKIINKFKGMNGKFNIVK